jgi:thymidylate kinase
MKLNEENFTYNLMIYINKNVDKYCVLRNYKFLPVSTGGSDLDILIDSESVDNFNTLLLRFIEENSLKLVSLINDKQCPKYCISGSGWGIQIDAFKNSVYFGNKEIISSSILFKNTKNYNNIIVLNERVGVLLSFLKELLNNKVCEQKYIVDLQQQFDEQDIDAQLLSQFTPQFVVYINQNLHHLDERHCLELHQLSKISFRRSKYYGFNSKLGRLLKQPGFIIAFLGTDGSGKSTIIKNITPALNDAFHNAVYYEHMRPNKFPSIARLLGNKEEFSGPVTNPHGSSTSGFLGSLLRWSYYTLDYTFGFYLKVWPKKAIRSCVWIFDRYYYDYLIDPKRGRIKLPYWILKFGQSIIPEPDIILCLGADAGEIHQRKPELPLAEVERQVLELKTFCDSHKKAVWIDTGKDIKTSSNDALEVINTMMSKRFELK